MTYHVQSPRGGRTSSANASTMALLRPAVVEPGDAAELADRREAASPAWIAHPEPPRRIILPVNTVR